MKTKTNKKKVKSNIHRSSSSTKVAGAQSGKAATVTDTGVGCSTSFGSVYFNSSKILAAVDTYDGPTLLFEGGETISGLKSNHFSAILKTLNQS